MADVHVTIDGREVSVPANSTVLDAAEAAGVHIATLCHHPAVEPIGACRVCLIEIEKQRVLQPACTFPVSEGMVVHTDSEAVRNSRRFVLQLLFSERNHFCMFCQMSGSCELQDLAYENGLDHWEFDRPFNPFAVDASRKFFAMDHNRCILCRRCIRACDEVVGNGTLGLKNRGADTMIVADLDVPFGESSCVSCGTCLQVCPTGALMDRASAYLGATAEVSRVKSRCMACSVGCGVELVVRGNHVIRVEGDWDAEPNKGLLCEIGRFHPLHEKRQRVRKPLVRRDGVLGEASWEEALQVAAQQIKACGDRVCTVASGFVTNEEALALVSGLPGSKVTMGAALAPQGGALGVLDEADIYIVAGANLAENHQVAGFAIKRSVRHRGARLIVLSDEPTGLDDWALSRWTSAEADRAIKIAAEAELPVLIYDAANAPLARSLAERLPRARLLGLADGGNSLGLAQVGIASLNSQQAQGYLVVAGEQPYAPQGLMEALEKAAVVVVQASYREPWDQTADVILPMPTTFEKEGSFVNTEGKAVSLHTAVNTALPGVQEMVAGIGNLLR